MSSKPKNEFAFPQLEGERLKWWGHGMTLRDYFAAKAMQGYIISHGVVLRPDEVARMSYVISDALLKEREDTALQGAKK
jgi:hypothetical protein